MVTTDHSDNAIEDEALLADINRYERAATRWREARRWREEGNCLVFLNAVLIEAGTPVGQTWEINDSIYRVVTLGNPCVRVGSSLPVPSGGPDTDPDHSDRDEMNDRLSEYASMVRVGQL